MALTRVRTRRRRTLLLLPFQHVILLVMVAASTVAIFAQQHMHEVSFDTSANAHKAPLTQIDIGDSDGSTSNNDDSNIALVFDYDDVPGGSDTAALTFAAAQQEAARLLSDFDVDDAISLHDSLEDDLDDLDDQSDSTITHMQVASVVDDTMDDAAAARALDDSDDQQRQQPQLLESNDDACAVETVDVETSSDAALQANTAQRVPISSTNAADPDRDLLSFAQHDDDDDDNAAAAASVDATGDAFRIAPSDGLMYNDSNDDDDDAVVLRTSDDNDAAAVEMSSVTTAAATPIDFHYYKPVDPVEITVTDVEIAAPMDAKNDELIDEVAVVAASVEQFVDDVARATDSCVGVTVTDSSSTGSNSDNRPTHADFVAADRSSVLSSFHSVVFALATAAEQLVYDVQNDHWPQLQAATNARSNIQTHVDSMTAPLNAKLRTVIAQWRRVQTHVASLSAAGHAFASEQVEQLAAVVDRLSCATSAAIDALTAWCSAIWETYAFVRVVGRNAIAFVVLLLGAAAFGSLYRVAGAFPNVVLAYVQSLDAVTRAQLKIGVVVVLLLATYHARVFAWFWVVGTTVVAYYYWSGHIVITIEFK